MKFPRLQRILTRISDQFGISVDLQRVLQGAGIVMVVQIAAAMINYANQVLLARWAGPDQFGAYVFAWSWTIPLASAAAIGLAAAAIRFVPQYLSASSSDLLHGYVRKSTSLSLAAGLSVAVAGLLIIWLLGDRMATIYIAPTQIALICVPFLTLIVLQSGIARGFGWVLLAFVPQMIFVPAAIVVGATIHLLFIGKLGATEILVWALAGCVTIAITHFIAFRRAMPVDVRLAAPAYETRRWLRVAVPLFLADGVFIILWNADTVMLAGFMQPRDIAMYHASAKTAALTYLVANAVRAIAAPKFSTLIMEGDRGAHQQFTRSIAAWTFWLSAIAVLVILIFGKLILSVFGSEYVAGYPLLVVLCFGYLARTLAGPVTAYLAVSGHHDDVLVVSGGAAIANVILNVILIPFFGTMGAAIATVLAMLGSQVIMYLLVRARLGINPFFLSRS